jgi:beta-galactosidase
MHETGVDNHALAAPLDFASYDNYPLGRTDLIMSKCSAEELTPYIRTGHPDYATYYQDQTRGLLDRGFWIMEQQPGPVNWANSNPRPLPGMVRFWTLEAFAHGAECVSYFRWRQVAFAQEQMHAGLLRNDNSESEYLPEIKQVINEVLSMELVKESKTHSRVAILGHAQSNWISDIERQSQFFEADTVQRNYYSALRQLGLDVDFIPAERDFALYDLVVVPCMPILTAELIERIQQSGSTFIFGPRTGSKTDEFSLPDTLPPGPLQRIVPVRVLSVETTRVDCPEQLNWNGNRYDSVIWREHIDPGRCETVATLNKSEAAVVRLDRFIYVATLTCSRFLVDFFEDVCRSLQIETVRCPEGVRITRRGDLAFAFNYSSEARSIEPARGAELLLGSCELKPQDVAVWRTSSIP